MKLLKEKDLKLKALMDELRAYMNEKGGKQHA